MRSGYSPAARPALLLLMAAVSLAGCARQDPATTASAPATAPAQPGEKRYPLRGEIVAVKPAEKVLVIHHEAIPGYMPAMTMEFAVGAGDLRNAQPGQRIRGEMVYKD